MQKRPSRKRFMHKPNSKTHNFRIGSSFIRAKLFVFAFLTITFYFLLFSFCGGAFVSLVLLVEG